MSNRFAASALWLLAGHWPLAGLWLLTGLTAQTPNLRPPVEFPHFVLISSSAAKAGVTTRGGELLVAYGSTPVPGLQRWPLEMAVCDADFRNAGRVYRDPGLDLTSPRDISCAFVGGANKWVVVCQTGDMGMPQRLQLFVVDASDPAGTPVERINFPLPIGRSYLRPRLGGTERGGKALLVFEDQSVSVGRSQVVAALIDPTNLSASSPVVLRDLGLLVQAFVDQTNPSVNRLASDPGDPWVVAFAEVEPQPQNDDSDIIALQVDESMQPSNVATIGETNDPSTPDSTLPRVAGRDGNYLVAMIHTGAGRDVVATQRFSPGSAAVRTIHEVGGGALQDLAFDHITGDQWALSYVPTASAPAPAIVRLGSTGRPIERNFISSTSSALRLNSLEFAEANQAFTLGYEAGNTLFGQVLAHDPDGGASSYGISCGGDVRIDGTVPRAGSTEIRCELAYAAPMRLAALSIASSPANVGLAGLGLEGCVGNIDFATSFAIPAMTDVTGRARVAVPLGDDALFIGDLFLQWFYEDPNAPRTLPVSASGGLEVRLRL